VTSAVTTLLAAKALDDEEARLKAVIGRLVDDTAKARRELEEIQVARKVMQRIQVQHEQQPQIATSGSKEPEAEDAPEGITTIKEAVSRALKAVYPHGLQKAGIEAWIKDHLNREINSASLSVMLARLRDDDNAIRNDGNVWFYIPVRDRKAA